MKPTRMPLPLAMALVLALPPGAQVAPAGRTDASSDCRRLVAEGRFEESLDPCRRALSETMDPEVLEAAALAETQAGEPEAACALWERLRARGPFGPGALSGYGLALWRAGRPDDGEALLRQAVAAGGRAEAHRALLDLHLTLHRLEGAERDLQKALKTFPKDCGIRERAVALYAALGQDARAAKETVSCRDLRCPPYGWARQPGLWERLDRSPFRELLRPEAISEDLPRLSDEEARFRLMLLERAMGPAALAPLAEDLPRRSDYSLRLLEAHLIVSQGAKALPELDRLLREEDLLLRKVLLRAMVQDPDPSFAPLLEERLGREGAPDNRSLAALALAKLYLQSGRKEEARALLLAIPPEDPLAAAASEELKALSSQP